MIVILFAKILHLDNNTTSKCCKHVNAWCTLWRERFRSTNRRTLNCAHASNIYTGKLVYIFFCLFVWRPGATECNVRLKVSRGGVVG